MRGWAGILTVIPCCLCFFFRCLFLNEDHHDQLVDQSGGHPKLALSWHFVFYIFGLDHSICAFVHFYHTGILVRLSSCCLLPPEHAISHLLISVVLVPLGFLLEEGGEYFPHPSVTKKFFCLLHYPKPFHHVLACFKLCWGDLWKGPPHQEVHQALRLPFCPLLSKNKSAVYCLGHLVKEHSCLLVQVPLVLEAPLHLFFEHTNHSLSFSIKVLASGRN